MMTAIASAILYVFLVTLQPQNGTPGGPVQVRVEAHDANTARRLARIEYAPAYRVSNVAPKGRVRD